MKRVTKKFLSITLLVMVAFTVSWTSSFAAEFQNGSFEIGDDPGVETVYGTGLPGVVPFVPSWDIYDGYARYVGTGMFTPSGIRSVSLAGVIGQTFDTVRGQTYNVNFYVSTDPRLDPSINVVYLIVQTSDVDARYYSLSPDPAGDIYWRLFTFSFVAEGPVTTLTFRSDSPDDYGPTIDGITVTEVITVCDSAKTIATEYLKTLNLKPGLLNKTVAKVVQDTKDMEPCDEGFEELVISYARLRLHL